MNVSGFASQRVHPGALHCTSTTPRPHPCPPLPVPPQNPNTHTRSDVGGAYVIGGRRECPQRNITIHLPRRVQLHTAILHQASRWLPYAEPAQKSPFWRRRLAEITDFFCCCFVVSLTRLRHTGEQLRDTRVELNV